jgi:4-amino-4-deoxy-L-arabinose transferase-like glycosyltransferase
LNFSVLKRNRYLIVILLLAIVSRIIWLKLTLNADEGELGYDAMLWLRGELPYTTRLSEKPPLAYLMYMAFEFLFGNTIIPVRIFNDVLFFISIIGFYFLVKSWYGKGTGLVASFLYAFFLNSPVFWGSYAVAIHLSMPFTIFSIVMCNKHMETGKIAPLIASGTFLSVAGLIRLNSFAIGIVLFVILILGRNVRPKSGIESSRRFLDALAGRISVLMASILLPILIAAIYFSAVGALGRIIYNILLRPVTEVAPVLASYSFPSGFPFGWAVLALMEGLPLLVFTILGCLACAVSPRRHGTHVIIWLLAPVPFLLALEPHDAYHFAVTVPAASVLSAIALLPSLERVYHILIDKRNRNKLRTHEMQSVFIVSILVLLLLPSLFFQALQFPSGTIHWEFVNWDYSTVGSYDQVMELAAYLKSLNVTDGGVLVQDWLPYVYWLTGIKAPTVHLDSYQIGLGIPLETYEKLHAEVKERAIPYVVVISERPEGTDNITDSVRNEYFLLKSIGDADVYSASYPIEEGVNYSFIAELQNAQAYALLPGGDQKPLAELNDTVVIPRIEKLTVENKTQYAISQHPLLIQSNMTYSNIRIPANTTLEFSIAMDPAVWNEGGDGVQFEVYIENNGQSNEIFSKYINPKANAEDRKWFFYSIPLKEYDNKVTGISFVTNPGPVGNNKWDWAYWGNPLIRQGTDH